MLYIVNRSYREDCGKNFTSYEDSIAPYRKSGALVGQKKKRMTAGTSANTQAPVNALCFDTTKLEFFNENVLLSEDTEPTTTD
jgi:hypothetical protein